jgi:hypothetical protein
MVRVAGRGDLVVGRNDLDRFVMTRPAPKPDERNERAMLAKAASGWPGARAYQAEVYRRTHEQLRKELGR